MRAAAVQPAPGGVKTEAPRHRVLQDRTAEIVDLSQERLARHGARVRPWRTSSTVRIYRPSRNVAQSGSANARHWVIEFEPTRPPEPDPLMGWTGSSDPMQQVRLTFPTEEQAVRFAERQGWIDPAPRPS